MQCSEKWSATVNQAAFLNHSYWCVLPWIRPAFGTNCQPIPRLCSGYRRAEVTEPPPPGLWVHARYHMKLYRYHTEVWGCSVTRYYRCTLWYYWLCGLCWLNLRTLQQAAFVLVGFIAAIKVPCIWFWSVLLTHNRTLHIFWHRFFVLWQNKSKPLACRAPCMSRAYQWSNGWNHSTGEEWRSYSFLAFNNLFVACRLADALVTIIPHRTLIDDNSD